MDLGADRHIYLGVDCGGTSLRITVASASGDFLEEKVVPTGPAQEEVNGLGEAIVSLVSGFLPESTRHDRPVGGIGIGLPFVCWDGKAHLCRNVRALDPLRLESRLGR